MNHEIDKVMKIADEFGSYLLREFQADTLSIAINKTGEGFTVSMECPARETDRGKIDALRESLTQTRKPELEDYYWQLAGDPLNPNALRMVSIMCDSIRVEYRDGKIALELTRLFAR